MLFQAVFAVELLAAVWLIAEVFLVLDIAGSHSYVNERNFWVTHCAGFVIGFVDKVVFVNVNKPFPTRPFKL